MKESSSPLDELDKSIIKLLERNGRMSAKEAAHELGKPVRTISYRIHRLEEQEVIEGYAAMINYKKLSKTIIRYKIFSDNPTNAAKKLARVPEIFKIQLGLGDGDLSVYVALESDLATSQFEFENNLRSLGITDFHRFIVAERIMGWI